jgi:hypothetical protein
MNNCMLIMGLASPVVLSSLGAFEVLVLAMAVPVSVALFLFADKIVNRVIVFAVAVSVIYGAERWWSSGDQPGTWPGQSTVQVSEAKGDMIASQDFQQARDAANVGAAGAVLVAAGLCFGRYVRSGLEKLRFQRAQMTA